MASSSGLIATNHIFVPRPLISPSLWFVVSIGSFLRTSGSSRMRRAPFVSCSGQSVFVAPRGSESSGEKPGRDRLLSGDCWRDATESYTKQKWDSYSLNSEVAYKGEGRWWGLMLRRCTWLGDGGEISVVVLLILSHIHSRKEKIFKFLICSF